MVEKTIVIYPKKPKQHFLDRKHSRFVDCLCIPCYICRLFCFFLHLFIFKTPILLFFLYDILLVSFFKYF